MLGSLVTKYCGFHGDKRAFNGSFKLQMAWTATGTLSHLSDDSVKDATKSS